MRQKSATPAQRTGERDLRIHGRPAARLVRHASSGARNARPRYAAWHAAAATNRCQARRDPPRAAAGALAPPPAPRTDTGDAQLLRRRIARGEQHDLRAPPLPPPVALGHVRDDARGLQVIKPALHALAMRPDKPRPLTATARTAPQPITGANPTTSCSTDVANRPDRPA